MRLISHPILCNYYLTYRCNATCNFCDIWEKPSPYITLEDVEDNLNDLKRLGVKVIDFTGGEPLLHQQLPQILQLAKEKGFITTVTSNGLLYPKQANKLKGLVDMLHFSLDHSSAEEHDKMRGVKCFDKVIESIKIANKLGERPDIIFTVFPNTINEIEKVYKEITKPNNLILILNPVFDYDGISNQNKFDDKSLKVLTKWGRKELVYLNQGFIELIKDGGNQVNDPVCLAMSSTIVISPNNELILPCYHLGKDSIPIDGNLKSLYESDRIENLRLLEGKHDECQGCTINCYMQPSFAVKLNKYWLKAFPSTMKYNFIKKTFTQIS